MNSVVKTFYDWLRNVTNINMHIQACNDNQRSYRCYGKTTKYTII